MVANCAANKLELRHVSRSTGLSIGPHPNSQPNRTVPGTVVPVLYLATPYVEHNTTHNSQPQQPQKTNKQQSRVPWPSSFLTFTMQENTSEDSSSNQEIVVMRLYWDEWSRCIGSRYQRDHLYRLGRFDTCSRQWKDFKIASKAKFIQFKDPEKARELINSTYCNKRKTISPTAGAIWELKKTPSWDWKGDLGLLINW